MISYVNCKPSGDFVETLGTTFLAHILKRVSDRLITAEEEWYAAHGFTMSPRTASMLFALDRFENLAITQLADLLHQSHQLSQRWVKELVALGLVETGTDPGDARRTLVGLTKAGRQETGRLKSATAEIENAVNVLLEEHSPGLFESLWTLERAIVRGEFVLRLDSSVRK